jgi:hypothetical protein
MISEQSEESTITGNMSCFAGQRRHSFVTQTRNAMPILKSSFEWSGTLDQLTAYRLPGVDGTVIRRKGGVSGDVIRNSRKYESTRRNNQEFKGRSIASGWIMRMMRPVSQLADHSIGGPLNALLKPVQESDTSSEWGKRHVLLSKKRNLLEGFSLNNQYPVNNVIRTPLSCTVFRDQLNATVAVPELVRGINFFPSPLAHLYSIIVVLGTVPDLFFERDSYYPSHSGYTQIKPSAHFSPWYPCAEGSPSFKMSTQIQALPPDENHSLMLCVGIRYGVVSAGNVIKQQSRAGCGCVMVVV